MLGFQLIAHRGCSADAPENTLSAFDRALLEGFTQFECDVQLTADGVCVVLHGEDLGVGKATLSGGSASGRVADTPWAQLQELDVGGWFHERFAGERIPTLEALLQRYAERTHIHLELKSKQPSLARVVAAAVHAHAPALISASATPAAPFPVPGLTITSFHLEQLVASKQALPRVPHAWLVHELTDDVVTTAVQHGLQGVCPRANVLTAAGVAAAVSSGLSVRAWGIRDLQLLDAAIATGAQGGTVNWPTKAARHLAAGGQTMRLPAAAAAATAAAADSGSTDRHERQVAH